MRGARQDQRPSRGSMHTVSGRELGTSVQHRRENDQDAHHKGDPVAVLRTFA